MLYANTDTRFWLGLGILLAFLVPWCISFWFFKRRIAREHKERELIGEDYHKASSPILSLVIREWFFEQLRPFVETFVRLRVSPNLLTTVGFLLSIASAYFYHKAWIGFAGWVLVFSGCFDMFDGVIARKTGQTTKPGAYYDSVLDRYADMIVLSGLMSYYLQQGSALMFWVVVAGVIGANMVSYTRARAECSGVNAKVGIMQRPERVVVLGLGSVFSSHFNALLSPWVPQEQYFLAGIVIFITVMTHITAFRRIRFTLNALSA